MVDETIRMIQKAEEEAAQMVKSGETRCAEIAAGAEEQAKALREEAAAKSTAIRTSKLEQAVGQGDMLKKQSEGEDMKQIADLKHQALQKEAEMIQVLIRELV